MKFIIIIIFSYFVIISCSPKTIILNRPKLTSLYFDKKINKLDNLKDLSLKQKRALVKTKVEYAYGILMEEGDRQFDKDYSRSIEYYKKANMILKDAKSISYDIMSFKYPNINLWLKEDYDIIFQKSDVSDMYWYAASLAGVIRSGRGSDPFELINIPIIGKLLKTAMNIDPEWGNGKLFSAMMSYTAIRSDLSGMALRDSVNFYYNKSLQLSDSLDASIFISYAELIHKPYQEKKKFIDKLNYVNQMEFKLNKKNEISYILSKRRAKWLLSKVDDYFLE